LLSAKRLALLKKLHILAKKIKINSIKWITIMNEEIKVEFNSLIKMDADALDFLLSEVEQKNTIRLFQGPGEDIIIKTKRDWNDLLNKLKIGLPEKKKDYRI